MPTKWLSWLQGSHLGFTPEVTLSRIWPHKLFLCVCLCPWVLHEHRSREGTTNIPYCCPRGAFVTCPVAVRHETEKLERLEQQRMAPSVCLTARCSWICGASSTRQLQDQHLHKTEARDMMLSFPEPWSSLSQEEQIALKYPGLSITGRKRREINPQNFNFCLFHLFLN